jgi:SAM-dependent methyltransferase
MGVTTRVVRVVHQQRIREKGGPKAPFRTWVLQKMGIAMMTSMRLDYDQIADTYNRRYADGGLKGVAAALHNLVGALDPQQLLEVGCGTGHWLAGLRAAGGRRYGLDLSSRMLAQAQEREERLDLVRGRASRLAFADAAFDLVYCINALHHFERQRAFLSDARRLLRPGGVLAIVGMDPRISRGRWYVYDIFEGTYETDLARFPSREALIDWMAAVGFEAIDLRIVEHIHDQKVGRDILDDPFLDKASTSQLALLTDEAYAAGVSRIRAMLAAAEAGGKTLTFPADLLLIMITGRVPVQEGGGR